MPGQPIVHGFNNWFFTAGRLLLNNAHNGCGLMVIDSSWYKEIGLTAVWLTAVRLAYSSCPLQVIIPARLVL